MQKWFSKLSDPEDITQLKNSAMMLKNSFDVELGNGRLRTDLILVVLSFNATNIANHFKTLPFEILHCFCSLKRVTLAVLKMWIFWGRKALCGMLRLEVNKVEECHHFPLLLCLLA